MLGVEEALAARGVMVWRRRQRWWSMLHTAFPPRRRFGFQVMARPCLDVGDGACLIRKAGTLGQEEGEAWGSVDRCAAAFLLLSFCPV
jgi:hypothetical protein